MRIHHGAHTRIERNPAKVLEPGHAHNFKAAVERPREAFSRFIDRERRAGIGSAIVLNTKARSATERPKHPEVLSVDRANPAFGFGTRPIEGRKPTTLQNAAGLRSEPPVSDPVATGTSPQARTTAAPPEEPPQVFVKSYGLRVAPKTLLKVCDPAPNSGVLVLPMVIAPARRTRSTIRSSSVGM